MNLTKSRIQESEYPDTRDGSDDKGLFYRAVIAIQTHSIFYRAVIQFRHVVDVMCLERKHRLQSGSFVKERELGIQLNKELDFPS